jgi:putative peptide maturation dehydrogenase
MRLRRCAVLWMEPRELAHFELEALLSGGTGVISRMQWFAHAPHLSEAVQVDPEDAVLLGELSPLDWVDATLLEERHGPDRVQALLRAGLLIGEDEAWAAGREADERFRAQHWHGLAAVQHMAARWEGLDSVQEAKDEGLDTSVGLRGRFGPPPPTLHERVDGGAMQSLARAPRTGFDELLDRRNSCRNFDTGKVLPQAQFAQLLERVFGARGEAHAADDFDVVKKTSPSGGALHPTEAYLIVRRVEGIAPGLYHYRPREHALQRLPWDGTPEELDAFARLAVVGQQWFADAHVLVVLAPRFARNFWKYRNHTKAYRVCILDAGHLSQTLFLSATEQGLGAFITAAINEVDIERAFGLTGYVDGPLAVCGFGIRADRMTTGELDPNHAVWPRHAD